MAFQASYAGPGRAALGLLALAAALAAGCSNNKRLTVEGTVTVRGKAVTAGKVKFHGPGERLEVGIINEDGTYAVTDIPPGDVKVTVEEDPAMAPSKGKAPVAAETVAIPHKYMDVNSSGLTYTITPGTNHIDLKLE